MSCFREVLRKTEKAEVKAMLLLSRRVNGVNVQLSVCRFVGSGAWLRHVYRALQRRKMRMPNHGPLPGGIGLGVGSPRAKDERPNGEEAYGSEWDDRHEGRTYKLCFLHIVCPFVL